MNLISASNNSYRVDMPFCKQNKTFYLYLLSLFLIPFNIYCPSMFFYLNIIQICPVVFVFVSLSAQQVGYNIIDY